jgi:hypothetical protein
VPEAQQVLSRGKRAMLLRLPPPLYEKLQRLTAANMARGKKASLTDTIVGLIEKARERSK